LKIGRQGCSQSNCIVSKTSIRVAFVYLKVSRNTLGYALVPFVMSMGGGKSNERKDERKEREYNR